MESLETDIPCYTIDLSEKPRDRYVDLAGRYKPQLLRLTSLFDELLADLGIPATYHAAVNRVARLMLRKVSSSIETEELRGIADVTGVPIYLLVSFNVILDLLMGCTSGAARSSEPGQPAADARMLHFRTLDWGMEPLRSIIVQLDFIQSKAATERAVLGSSITYVGFIGMLTAVRQSLSLSLNFRAVHNASTKAEQFRFYLHHVLVLLGMRQSIASLLRNCFFGSTNTMWSNEPVGLDKLAQTIPNRHTTAAYLIFSDGKRALAMEKDYCTAVVRQSTSFIVITNHDLRDDETKNHKISPAGHSAAMQELLDESADRRSSVVRRWERKLRDEKRRQIRDLENASQSTMPDKPHSTSVRLRKRDQDPKATVKGSRKNSSLELDSLKQTAFLSSNEVIRLTSAFPTTNECTHFAAVLDPKMGRVLWARRHLKPVERLDTGAYTSC